MTSNVDKLLREAIEKKAKDVDAKLNAKDYTGLATLYNEKCKLMPPTGETIVGKDEAAKYCQKAWGEATAGQVTTKIEEVTGDGDWAYSRGTYKFIDGGKELESGKNVTVWKKVNNEYQVYTDVWNISKKA